MLTDGFLRQYSLASGHKQSITCNPGAVSKEMVDGLLLCPKCPFWWKHGGGPEHLQRCVQMMPLGEGFLQRWSKLQVVTNVKYYKCG